MENISKFILIIADFNKNNCLLTSMKQLPLALFKSVAFFLGHPVVILSCFVQVNRSRGILLRVTTGLSILSNDIV